MQRLNVVQFHFSFSLRFILFSAFWHARRQTCGPARLALITALGTTNMLPRTVAVPRVKGILGGDGPWPW